MSNPLGAKLKNPNPDKVTGADMYPVGTVIAVLVKGRLFQYVVLHTDNSRGLYKVRAYPPPKGPFRETVHLNSLSKEKERRRVVCARCHTPLRDHANGEKCLYDPGSFEPWVIDLDKEDI